MNQQSFSKESELQNLLTDERERCDQYRHLYQGLKEEHVKLKDELADVYKQLKDVNAEKEKLLISKNDYICKLEEQLQDKKREIRQLLEEVKSFDSKRIKETIIEEVSTQYETKIKEIHAEADQARELYNTLHYDHAVLKCRFESRESEFSHTLERLKLQHLEEVEHLRTKIENLDREKTSPDDAVAVELGSTKHDILQLNSKLRGLLAECQELRAQNENLTMQLNSTQKTHMKQNANSLSNLRTLESEKQKAVMQKDVLEKELSNFQEQRRVINNDLQSSRREILSLKSALEESEHRCRVMVTDLQVENEHLKAQHEAELQRLMTEISRLKEIVAQTATELNRIQLSSVSKEKDLQQSVLALRQQIWKQSNEFDQQKEKMERKFLDYRNEKEYEVQVLQHNIEECAESKLELEKQFVALRDKVERVPKENDATATAQVVPTSNFDYENEIRELKRQIDSLKASSATLPEGFLGDLILRHQQSNQPNNYDEQREILELRLNWEQQKHQFHQRLEDLESQLKDCKNTSTTEKTEMEKKIQQYSKIVNRLKEKLETLKTQIKELENEKAVLQKNVPIEVHERVTSKLSQLERWLEDYRLVIAAEPHFARCSRSSPSTMPDKLLTDIKNLQIRVPPIGDSVYQYEPLSWQREELREKTPLPKRSSFTRRRSLKSHSRDQAAARISPVLTSSSDLELENL